MFYDPENRGLFIADQRIDLCKFNLNEERLCNVGLRVTFSVQMKKWFQLQISNEQIYENFN